VTKLFGWGNMLSFRVIKGFRVIKADGVHNL